MNLQQPSRESNLEILLLLILLLLAIPFPLTAQPQTVGLFLNDSAAFVGYTLFPPKHYTETYLINNEGMLCHSWPSDYAPGQSAYLLEDGGLLRACFIRNHVFGGGGEGGRVEQYDWDGNLTWAFQYSTDTCMQHHDIKPLPNGNVLMVAWELKSYNQAIAAGRRPNMLPDSVLWPDYIIEVDKTTGSIVWEWHMWDHLVQDYDSTRANYGVVGDHPELIDINQGEPKAIWAHVNSVYYNPDLDQILLSPRGYNEIWVIDHSTTTEEARSHSGGRSGKGGDLLYRWGNPQVYRRGGANDQKLFAQHDAQWIEDGLPGAGNMLIFNNGNRRPGGEYSSVDEIVPPVDSLGNYYLPPGGRYGPEEQLWIYRAENPPDFYSEAISGAHRLPNGNTLIDDGVHGTFFEVTPETTIVWLYINPVINTGPVYQGDTIPLDPRGHQYNAVFKIHRFAPDYPGLVGRNLEPRGPIERYHSGIDVEKTDLNRPRPIVLNQGRGTLNFINLPEQGIIEIYSVTGRLVQKNAFARPGKSWSWDLSNEYRIASGVYVCQIKNCTSRVLTSSKFVIVR